MTGSVRYGSTGRLGLDDRDDDTIASISGDDGIGGCCSTDCGKVITLSVALFGLLASHRTKNTSVTTTNDTMTVSQREYQVRVCERI